jgi:phosphotransferase system HPr (HPr) family protein
MISPMSVSRELTINLPKGLHLVPCSRIVERTTGFDGDVRIRWNDITADARSMLDLMTLAAPQGSVLTVEATGEEAESLLDDLEQLFARDFEN